MTWTGLTETWLVLVYAVCFEFRRYVFIYLTEINLMMYSLGGRMQVGNDATPCKNGVLNR